MTLKHRPSDLFTGTILQGFIAEERAGKSVITASAIWDHVCAHCLRSPGGFTVMFAWDTDKRQGTNRIGTILECIEAGYVPGLKLERNAKGGLYVVRDR
jgi:hypothetical protein